MADNEKARLVKLLEALREHQAKTYAITEELLELANGGQGVGDKLKQLEATFELLWSARYPGGRYLWAYVKDRPLEKQLLAAMPLAEIERRAGDYIRDDDPYLVKQRHPFALFRSQVNRYATVGDMLELGLPAIDCKHAPRCASDQEHTRKRMSELRV